MYPFLEWYIGVKIYVPWYEEIWMNPNAQSTYIVDWLKSNLISLGLPKAVFVTFI